MLGIIGAMDVEVDKLKGMLSEASSKKIAGIDFVSGKLSGKNCVIARCNPGKVNAAVCAQIMITEYKPSLVVNVGVAGSLSNELDIGEVAVATSTVQYDMDTSALGDPKGFISGLGLVELECDKEIVKKLTMAAESAKDIKYMTGKIATGDRFVSEDEIKEQIKNDFGCVACEMEGGAVGHVCILNSVPYGVIRAISDKADGSSVMDYPAFTRLAAENSVKIMAEFVKLI